MRDAHLFESIAIHPEIATDAPSLAPSSTTDLCRTSIGKPSATKSELCPARWLLGVVARTAVDGGDFTGSAISQEASPFSRGYSRWNSTNHWHWSRFGWSDCAWQEYYAVPQAVGKRTAGPARHFLIDPASDLHGGDVGVVGVGPGLAKLASTADGLGTDSLFRRQDSS